MSPARRTCVCTNRQRPCDWLLLLQDTGRQGDDFRTALTEALRKVGWGLRFKSGCAFFRLRVRSRADRLAAAVVWMSTWMATILNLAGQESGMDAAFWECSPVTISSVDTKTFEFVIAQNEEADRLLGPASPGLICTYE